MSTRSERTIGSDSSIRAFPEKIVPSTQPSAPCHEVQTVVADRTPPPGLRAKRPRGRRRRIIPFRPSTGVYKELTASSPRRASSEGPISMMGGETFYELEFHRPGVSMRHHSSLFERLRISPKSLPVKVAATPSARHPGLRKAPIMPYSAEASPLSHRSLGEESCIPPLLLPRPVPSVQDKLRAPLKPRGCTGFNTTNFVRYKRASTNPPGPRDLDDTTHLSIQPRKFSGERETIVYNTTVKLIKPTPMHVRKDFQDMKLQA